MRGEGEEERREGGGEGEGEEVWPPAQVRGYSYDFISFKAHLILGAPKLCSGVCKIFKSRFSRLVHIIQSS